MLYGRFIDYIYYDLHINNSCVICVMHTIYV